MSSLSIVLVVLAACGDAPPLAARVLAEEEAAYTALCDCHDALGYADAQSCYLAFVARTDEETACVEALFEANMDVLEDVLRCQVDVAEDAQRCMAQVNACDRGAVLACATPGFAAQAACGAYPEGVEAGRLACYGVEP